MQPAVKIVSLKSGETLYDLHSQLLLHPASNMKLLTSATALGVLGRDFRFRTDVLVDSGGAGELRNIYLKGFGDPDLTTKDLDSLAAEVMRSGLSSVTGNVVADNTYFDDSYWGNGWMWDDEPDPDEMFISALSVNKNCVFVTVTPGTMAGDSLKVAIDPPTSYVTLLNNGRTVSDSVRQPLRVSRLFKERLNTITVNGEMKNDSSSVLREELSVWRPELYAAQLFKEELQKAGVAVAGNAVAGVVPPNAILEAEHVWPMDSMVVNMDKVSDNLSAENTLKVIAAVTLGPPGSDAGGIFVVHRFLSSLGIDTTKFLMVDGSGVSHYNLLTAGILVQLLDAMAHRADLFPLFCASLPVAGVDGTLKGRMKGTIAEGNVRAKTGTISATSTLSGYAVTRDTELLAFSMMMQHFIGSGSSARLAQDRIAALLANFSRSRVYPLDSASQAMK